MQDIRWRQRHSNFTSVLKLLENNFQGKDPADFSELEQIGLAKSFELCFELLWKLLKDYLEHEEIEIGLISPKNVLQATASSGLLQKTGADGDVLLRAHKARNELAHIYDRENFFSALVDVKNSFLPEIIKVDMYFKRMVSLNE